VYLEALKFNYPAGLRIASLKKDAYPGIAEVEDAKKRLAGYKRQ